MLDLCKICVNSISKYKYITFSSEGLSITLLSFSDWKKMGKLNSLTSVFFVVLCCGGVYQEFMTQSFWPRFGISLQITVNVAVCYQPHLLEVAVSFT